MFSKTLRRGVRIPLYNHHPPLFIPLLFVGKLKTCMQPMLQRRGEEAVASVLSISHVIGMEYQLAGNIDC